MPNSISPLFYGSMSIIGIAMGSTNSDELLLFFLPIVILLVINICVALFSYKYK